MKNAIIFDLDGTLWEGIESTYQSANFIANKYNLKEITKDTICSGFGLNKEESSKLYFPEMELKDSSRLIDEIAKINIENLKNNGGTIYPHVKDVLTQLVEKYDLYIVSNTAETDYIKAFLYTADVNNLFKDYIAVGGIGITKADAIKRIINKNNIEKAVYVGDTIADYEAAKNSNINFIQAKYGFGNNLNTLYSINEITELTDVSEEVFKYI